MLFGGGKVELRAVCCMPCLYTASGPSSCRLEVTDEGATEGDYDCELVILADGWKLRLVDPYSTAPKLYVRRPGTTEESE